MSATDFSVLFREPYTGIYELYLLNGSEKINDPILLCHTPEK